MSKSSITLPTRSSVAFTVAKCAVTSSGTIAGLRRTQCLEETLRPDDIAAQLALERTHDDAVTAHAEASRVTIERLQQRSGYMDAGRHEYIYNIPAAPRHPPPQYSYPRTPTRTSINAPKLVRG